MIVQAAMTLLVFLGLSAFAVDYGVLWLSRAQAQNAADAGAIAGAIACAYDTLECGPSGSFGVIADSARRVVEGNPVWFDAVATASLVSYTCPRCVKVDVYRDGTSGSVALPVFFGPVLGITSQRVQATATAQVAVGNGTTCLKPWAIPDKWIENRAPANVFEKYEEGGAGAGTPLVPGDDYRPPTAVPPGGYELMDAGGIPVDLGAPLTLSFADPEGNDPISSGFLLPLVLPGAKTYEENIAGCNGQRTTFEQEIETGTSGMAVATMAGFQNLFDSDPTASWVANNVAGSCAPGCGPISPRLVELAVFDVDQYQLRRATGAPCGSGPARCVNVVNIVGFFIENVAGGIVTGRLARYPGRVWPNSPTVPALSSFLPAITLVR